MVLIVTAPRRPLHPGRLLARHRQHDPDRRHRRRRPEHPGRLHRPDLVGSGRLPRGRGLHLRPSCPARLGLPVPIWRSPSRSCSSPRSSARSSAYRRCGSRALYLAIATLASQEIIMFVVRRWQWLTDGPGLHRRRPVSPVFELDRPTHPVRGAVVLDPVGDHHGRGRARGAQPVPHVVGPQLHGCPRPGHRRRGDRGQPHPREGDRLRGIQRLRRALRRAVGPLHRDRHLGTLHPRCLGSLPGHDHRRRARQHRRVRLRGGLHDAAARTAHRGACQKLTSVDPRRWPSSCRPSRMPCSASRSSRSC
jgi:hypothetical protein